MIRLRFTGDHGGRVAGEVRDYDERSAANLLDAGVAVLAGEQAPEVYDPAGHTVEEVLAYLDGADEAEADRVRALESAGRDRVGLRHPTPSEGA